ncbi:MAG: D-aminoacylase [Candidatus Freyarchaeota archaeon]|nr:D-aminoacylase [Candidatus Jordarchaeia archaeon]MBS7267392.1 D-aminoacylase [Candidatus Jordarchaeia archaeon]MBS7278697.1 D-aminoacylase [Candidatus Jordarchaeia archaeon]
MDIVVENARIIDGTGNPWFKGELGITGEKIAEMDRSISTRGERVIDAKGLIVAPGFIDVHTHSDATLLMERSALNYISQGVTTSVIGNCGLSAAPLNKRTVKDLLTLVAPDFRGDPTEMWTSFGGYLDFLTFVGSAINVVPLVGHNTIRIAVMGIEERDPSEEELGEMRRLTEHSMREGAFGLSAGLIYVPGIFTKTEELIELCKVVSKYEGIFAIHIRGEGDTGMQAIKEAIEIARKAQVPLEISHFKAEGKRNWGKAQERLRLIEDARSEGVDVTADFYPYTFALTFLHSLLPTWIFREGLEAIPEKLKNSTIREQLREYFRLAGDVVGISEVEDWRTVVLSNPSKPRYKGKSILEIAEEQRRDVIDTVCELVQSEGLSLGILLLWMSEEDVNIIAKHPLTMVGSDGAVVTSPKEMIHPRYYGTFTRVLGYNVREKKLMGLEEAVRKMTSLPAQKFGLKDRGILREGNYADCVIFDPQRVRDCATIEAPNRLSEGIEYVIVNGTVVFEHRKFVGKYPGKILRKS